MDTEETEVEEHQRGRSLKSVQLFILRLVTCCDPIRPCQAKLVATSKRYYTSSINVWYAL